MPQANFSQNRAKKKKKMNKQNKMIQTHKTKKKKLMVAREESGGMDEKDGYYNQ